VSRSALANRKIQELEERLRAAEAKYVVQSDDDPVEWSQHVSGNRLDQWQIDFLRCEDSDILLNCARQTGKSEIVSLRAAFRARVLKRRVVCLAPTQRQSGFIYGRAKRWLINSGADFSRLTATELELSDGGSVVALPGDRPDVSVRGDTVDDLIVDEASQVRDSLIAAATPTTATRANASITYLSTPAGKRGAFYRAWSKEGWWRKFTVTASQCPRISSEFLSRERLRLGPLYDQEYECEFLSSPGALFDASDIERMFLPEQPEDWQIGEPVETWEIDNV
jgi:hypothetical protein